MRRVRQGAGGGALAGEPTGLPCAERRAVRHLEGPLAANSAGRSCLRQLLRIYKSRDGGCLVAVGWRRGAPGVQRVLGMEHAAPPRGDQRSAETSGGSAQRTDEAGGGRADGQKASARSDDLERPEICEDQVAGERSDD